ncbi:peptidase C65 otubain protein (macronuclear) [Tetrahymena thermophila SB210]|uniref:ubiquitinyl hydrolase 1 n=1 Tax=Tetrahymena thermophila (strain SB210) TaxID=312017 RepID=W7X8T0_TETTS|nr:peptidase C65 otubain protein [Tetrahymena thermophila SB210]EWS73767.1 peptidase C65 otubain protein [Tetrahymena thermophila SB210]|eukprot:XP_012653698.1 peptidase C65 otubain protein [Tetrahymena thermophila SB210]
MHSSPSYPQQLDSNQGLKLIDKYEMKQIIAKDANYIKIQQLVNDDDFQNKIYHLDEALEQSKYGNYNLKISETQGYRYYNNNIKSEVKKILVQFPYLIDVRGDDNCFYRSVILSFLLQLFKPNEIQMYPEFQIKAIQRLIRQVENLENCIKKNEMNLPYKIQNTQIIDLKNLFLNHINGFLEEFFTGKNILDSIIETLNISNHFDFSCVIICRYMIFKQFLLHKSNPSLNQFRDQDVINHIHQLLLSYGTQAEDMIIKLAAEAFQCNLIVQNLYNEGSNIINSQLIFQPLSQQSQIILNVPVLYTNGHYMCLVDQDILKKGPILQENVLSQKPMNYLEESKQQSQKCYNYFPKSQDEMKDIFQNQCLKNNEKKINFYKKNDYCFSPHSNGKQNTPKYKLKNIKYKEFTFMICTECQEQIQKEKQQLQEKSINYFYLEDFKVVLEYNSLIN